MRTGGRKASLLRYLTAVTVALALLPSSASAFSAESQASGRFSMQAWLSDLSGGTKHLLEEIRGSDLVVMIASAGEDVPVAALIGETCSIECVTTSALVIGGPAAIDQALARTLAQLRPWALMLVVASAEEYVADMLGALRA